MEHTNGKTEEIFSGVHEQIILKLSRYLKKEVVLSFLLTRTLQSSMLATTPGDSPHLPNSMLD